MRVSYRGVSITRPAAGPRDPVDSPQSLERVREVLDDVEEDMETSTSRPRQPDILQGRGADREPEAPRRAAAPGFIGIDAVHGPPLAAKAASPNPRELPISTKSPRSG